jgi:tRNA A37 threonylcarbamoyladenosine dehydratase
VGSWAAEALVRSGAGRIALVDPDAVCESNINRQAQALPSTVGLSKVAVLRDRLLAVNPACAAEAFEAMFAADCADDFGIAGADYVIDAIDSLPHKLDLIEACADRGTTLFSSMGMARKLDPTRIRVADIWDTHGCPLARLVRQGLRKRGFSGHFAAVYSDESPPPAHKSHTEIWRGASKSVNGSFVGVTAPAGFTLASLVVRDMCLKYPQK